jgi:hypothetical protein
VPPQNVMNASFNHCNAFMILILDSQRIAFQCAPLDEVQPAPDLWASRTMATEAGRQLPTGESRQARYKKHLIQ